MDPDAPSISPPDPRPTRPGLVVLGLSCLGSFGLGLALASRPREQADRPPVAATTLAPAPAPAAEDGAGRLSKAIGRARASTVALEYDALDLSGRRRVATGIKFSDRGDVLSVWVDPPSDPGPGRDRPPIIARDEAGHRHRAAWVAADPGTGLTLLRVVDAEDIPTILPAARTPSLGSEVLVIGNPFGLGHSVGRGYVAGLDRRVEGRPGPLGGLIQVQVPLHPGDGGALVADLDGGWLGVVRGGMAPPDDELGLAIPAADALWVAGQLRERGQVDRAYLGVRFRPEGEGEGRDEGAEFSEVLGGSPAELAGLKGGDRVVRLDGRVVRTSADVTDRLDRTAAGSKVVLEYARGEARESKTLRTGSRPQTTLAVASPPVASPEPPRPTGPTLERLERRLDELERREKPAPTP